MSELGQALQALTEKQRFVIEMKWGLRGDREHSLREISELMGVHVNAVWKHHELALERLRGEVDSSLLSQTTPKIEGEEIPNPYGRQRVCTDEGRVVWNELGGASGRFESSEPPGSFEERE